MVSPSHSMYWCASRINNSLLVVLGVVVAAWNGGRRFDALFMFNVSGIIDIVVGRGVRTAVTGVHVLYCLQTLTDTVCRVLCAELVWHSICILWDDVGGAVAVRWRGITRISDGVMIVLCSAVSRLSRFQCVLSQCL